MKKGTQLAAVSIVASFAYIANAYSPSTNQMPAIKKTIKKNYVATAWRNTGDLLKKAANQGKKQ